MTSRPDYFQEAQVPDMERRLASMLRIGTVSALNYDDPNKPRVRVTSGKVTTGWIPWGAVRAGGARTWAPLELGEQVIVAAPSGDLAQAVVIGSLFYNSNPAPSSNKQVTVTEWGDGAKETYNQATHERRLDVPSGGKVVIKVGSTTFTLTDLGAQIDTDKITFNGDIDINGHVKITGGLEATQDVVASSISLVGHVHGGVERGGSNTNEPQG